MPVFQVLLKADLENVARLAPQRGRRWGFKFQCAKCREIGDKFVYVSEEEAQEAGGGTHNAIWTCKFCKAQIGATIDSKSYGAFEGGQAPAPILSLEVRGAEPVELDLEAAWEANAVESETPFADVDLTDDWCDYDETGAQSVSVMSPEVTFQRKK